jgi:hypothetical protein
VGDRVRGAFRSARDLAYLGANTNMTSDVAVAYHATATHLNISVFVMFKSPKDPREEHPRGSSVSCVFLSQNAVF